MRKIVCALTLTSALLFTLVAQAAAPANFGGTWTLDKTKSQGLSPRVQGADSVTWTITQNDKEITIEEKITGGQMGGPGGPGGGRGGFGGPRTYKLDGSETTNEMGRGKVARKATWSNDSKTLELVSKSTFQGQEGNEITSTSTDKLSLSEDGKTLTVVRHAETPRGTQDSTMVFTK
jgi:hypothetical protein